jgi:hypothetical protein
VIEVIAQETIAGWLAFEIGLLVRDWIRGKGSLARDKGTVWLNFLFIAVAVSGAGALSGPLRHTAWYFGSTGLSVVGLLLMWAAPTRTTPPARSAWCRDCGDRRVIGCC